MRRVNFSFLVLLAALGCNHAAAPKGETASRSSAFSVPRQNGYEGPREQEPARRRSRRGRPQAQAAPGQFDFYLLNLSWSPEFCATHSDSPECGRNLGFVVHGLWPQDNDGDYPQNCGDAPGPATPQAHTDLIPTASLVEHEWRTHGTCSGLTADAYFSEIRKAFAGVRIPPNIGSGGDADGVAPESLLARFATANPTYPPGSFALSCGNNRLTAVEICLSKDLQPEPCRAVRSCRANVVKVTPK